MLGINNQHDAVSREDGGNQFGKALDAFEKQEYEIALINIQAVINNNSDNHDANTNTQSQYIYH